MMKNTFTIQINKDDKKSNVVVSYLITDETGESCEHVQLPEYVKNEIHSAIQNDNCLNSKDGFEVEPEEDGEYEGVEYFVEWNAEVI